MIWRRSAFFSCLLFSISAFQCSGRIVIGRDGLLSGIPLPPVAGTIDNVRVSIHHDTAIVTFDPVDNAADYRIYLAPNASEVITGPDGEPAIRNAIYRCAGDTPKVARENDQAESTRFSLSLAGDVAGYTGRIGIGPRLCLFGRRARSTTCLSCRKSKSKRRIGLGILGSSKSRKHGRRLCDRNWSTRCTRGPRLARRRHCVYAPDAGTLPVYRREYTPNSDGSISVYYTDGPEHDARPRCGNVDRPKSFGERFQILKNPLPGAVPLHRVFYAYGNGHDVLAAGEARYQIALHQGNRPIASLSWPALTGSTTLVIEALDQGCPFPNGFIGFSDSPPNEIAGLTSAPTITLPEARSPATGELFYNGQHDPKNRPRVIARAVIAASPISESHLDWSHTFGTEDPWQPLTTILNDDNGFQVYRNGQFSFEFAGPKNLSFGPVLGQLIMAGGQVAALGITPMLSSDHFLHVKMASDIPATDRRFPHIWITDVPIATPEQVATSDKVLVRNRLGPVPSDNLPPGTNHTLIVETRGTQPDLQIQFCDQRGWGVNEQCPLANIYGYTEGIPPDRSNACLPPGRLLGEGWEYRPSNDRSRCEYSTFRPYPSSHRPHQAAGRFDSRESCQKDRM